VAACASAPQPSRLVVVVAAPQRFGLLSSGCWPPSSVSWSSEAGAGRFLQAQAQLSGREFRGWVAGLGSRAGAADFQDGGQLQIDPEPFAST